MLINDLEPVLRLIHEEDRKSLNAAAMIYGELRNRCPVHFGEYLKAYIRRLTGIAPDSPLSEYAEILLHSFYERGVPTSFRVSQVRPSTFARNCLTQRSVSRETVFLLGFGLGMSLDEIDDFLVHVLCEQTIRFRIPFEVICWYCFYYRYGYGKYLQLTNEYERVKADPSPDLSNTLTMDLKQYIIKIARRESDLIPLLARLKTGDGSTVFSVTIKSEYDKLYDEVRRLLLGERNGGQMSVSSSDIESFLYRTLPKDKNGNLIPYKLSRLYDIFRVKRLTRQRITKLNNGSVSVDRSDLMTFYYIIFCVKFCGETPSERKTRLFQEGINSIFQRCGLCDLNPKNPFEAFLLMCLQTQNPLDTMADVYELSYSKG